MNYSWALPFINRENIRVIFELGSRDCLDAVYLSRQYRGAKVFAFEANPDCFEECRKTIAEYEMEDYCQLVPKAVSNKNGTVEFWKCDTAVCKNIGISSLFPLDFSKRSEEEKAAFKPIQIPISVESIRLDSFCFETGVAPDLLCMDIQEGELLALESCGDFLEKVRYIILETCLQGTYKGGCTFRNISFFLKSREFEYVYSNEYLENHPPEDILTSGFCFFDCLFQNTRFL